MPKQQKTKGEKQIKKSESKKKEQKPPKKEEDIEENVPKTKSPPVKSHPTSVKKKCRQGWCHQTTYRPTNQRKSTIKKEKNDLSREKKGS